MNEIDISFLSLLLYVKLYPKNLRNTICMNILKTIVQALSTIGALSLPCMRLLYSEETQYLCFNNTVYLQVQLLVILKHTVIFGFSHLWDEFNF